MKLIPVDVYDKDGNLTRLEFFNEAGEFVIQFLWDPNDEQTSEKRQEFRQWAYRHINNNTDDEVEL
jgi:putative heme degradation protein